MTMIALRVSGLHSPPFVHLLHTAAHSNEAGRGLTLQTVGWILAKPDRPHLPAPTTVLLFKLILQDL